MPSTNTLLKYGSLAIVIPHSITYTILGAISRRPDADGNVFYGPSAVFLMEIGKLIISLIGVTLTLAQLHASSVNARDEKDESMEALLATSNMSRSSSQTSSPLLDARENKRERRRSSVAAGQVRIQLEKEPLRYSPDTVLAMAAGKRSVSLLDRIKAEIVTPKAFKLCAPALLYAFQNNFQIFAAGFLTPAEYQILTQLKLVCGAIFSVLILGKRLNTQRWTSIFTLTIGVSIVQFYSLQSASQNDAVKAAADASLLSQQQPQHHRSHFDLVVGTLLMIGASACSGLAGVLIEALLKGSNSIWTTNVHLAFFSLLSASAPILTDIYARGQIDILRHFNAYVWTLIVFNMGGGVMMAMVLKYADNILEKFAVAISLVGTVLLSSFVSSIPLHSSQYFGAAVVVTSAVAYGLA